MTDLNLIDTDTLAAACRTAAVSSAHADLLNAAAARLLAQASWIDGAKVDLDGYDEARAESQRATAWHMEALDDLAACVAERDDWRRRYEAVDTWVRENCREWDVDDGETVTTPLDELVESISIWREDHTRQKRRYEALRDGVTGLADAAQRWDPSADDIWVRVDYLRAVVARVEES